MYPSLKLVRHRMPLCLLLCAAPLAWANTLPPVADPAAPVPTRPYVSVLGSNPNGMETGQLDWRRANAEVGQFPRGHADIVKWESQVDAVVPGAGTAPAPASPPVLSAPPAATPHRHH